MTRQTQTGFPLPLAAFGLLALGGLFACASPEGAESFVLPAWKAPSGAEQVIAHSGKVGGCAAGDLDGLRGQEVVAVCGDGSVIVAWLERGEWRSETVHRLEGEAIGVAVLPNLSGARGFVTVGKLTGDEDSPGEGAAYLFSRATSTQGNPAQGWKVRLLLTDSALIHGVDTGDWGVVMAGYSGDLHGFLPGPNGLEHRVLGQVPGPAKGVSMDLGGVAVACATGELLYFDKPENLAGEADWASQIVWRFPDALARVDSMSGKITVCSNDGGLYCYERGGVGDVLFYQSTDRLRGAVLLETNPLSLGAPWYVATAGYDGTVSVFPKRGSREEPTHLAIDEERLHHLCGARLPYDGTPGGTPALIACGYSGRVWALPFREQNGRP